MPWILSTKFELRSLPREPWQNYVKPFLWSGQLVWYYAKLSLVGYHLKLACSIWVQYIPEMQTSKILVNLVALYFQTKQDRSSLDQISISLGKNPPRRSQNCLVCRGDSEEACQHQGSSDPSETSPAKSNKCGNKFQDLRSRTDLDWSPYSQQEKKSSQEIPRLQKKRFFLGWKIPCFLPFFPERLQALMWLRHGRWVIAILNENPICYINPLQKGLLKNYTPFNRKFTCLFLYILCTI